MSPLGGRVEDRNRTSEREGSRIVEQEAPLIVYANFMSEVAVDLSAHGVLGQWAAQAPRKVWLARAGDVLVTPVPLGAEFRAYAGELLDVPPAAVTVVTVPSLPGASMADAVRRAGLVGELRDLVARREGARLLPTALDRSAVALAAELGAPVAPYGPGGPDESALEVTSRLNTKAGFRAVAGELGMRLPPGRVCRRDRLARTAGELLEVYPRVVVKPDRSAGGHGLWFGSRTRSADAPWERDGFGEFAAADEAWVVEECLDVDRSVSIQLETGPEGPRSLFSGEMRTTDGSFTGYVSPLRGVAGETVAELERWGLALGRHLYGRGYAGPYGVDAVLTSDGTLFATESNVRRTATTTPEAMVGRLGRAAGLTSPAWLIGKRLSSAAVGFADVEKLLRSTGLGWDPGRGEGVVLYADAPADGRSWRYAVIAAEPARTAELEAQLAQAMRLTR
ncbi:preATP grasp domain-containing protein [Streptomyces sp. SYSU K217416]